MFTLLAEVSFRHGFICVADIRVVASRTYYANAKRRKRLRKKPCRKENSAGRVRDVLFDWSNRRTTTTSPGDGRKGAWERGSNISSTTIFTIVPFYVGSIIRNLEFNSKMKFGGTLVLKEFYHVSLLLPVYI